MIKLLANAATAASLLLSASAATPAWSAGKSATAKCHHSKAKQAKRTPALIKAQPSGGTSLVEKRKIDVQILSFGP